MTATAVVADKRAFVEWLKGMGVDPALAVRVVIEIHMADWHKNSPHCVRVYSEEFNDPRCVCVSPPQVEVIEVSGAAPISAEAESPAAEPSAPQEPFAGAARTAEVPGLFGDPVREYDDDIPF